jgi:hypothetical protein
MFELVIRVCAGLNIHSREHVHDACALSLRIFDQPAMTVQQKRATNQLG